MNIWKSIGDFFKTRSDQRGLAITEFALLLPVLVAMLFVTIEGANVLRTKMVLQEAAREGARQMLLQEGEGGGITELVEDMTTEFPSENLRTYVDKNFEEKYVNVRVEYDYEAMAFTEYLAELFTGEGIVLVASSTMPLP